MPCFIADTVSLFVSFYDLLQLFLFRGFTSLHNNNVITLHYIVPSFLQTQHRTSLLYCFVFYCIAIHWLSFSPICGVHSKVGQIFNLPSSLSCFLTLLPKRVKRKNKPNYNTIVQYSFVYSSAVKLLLQRLGFCTATKSFYFSED